MKWKSNKLILLLWLIFAWVSTSCKKHEHPQEHVHQVQDEGQYICPMRCEGDKTYPQPGSCPVCNMDLQLVQEELVQAISPNKQVLSRQATVKLQEGTVTQSVKANGYIDYDPNRNQNVSVRLGGRIEKLFVKYNLQFVRQGDKILELYSPELNTLQEEHLFLLKTETQQPLIEPSREKLRLLGLTAQQISALEQNGTFAQTISVFSPSSGYILFNTEGQNNTGPEANPQASMNGMGVPATSTATPAMESSGDQIREGMYVTKGQTLFRINDLQMVWAMLSIPSGYAASVQPGRQINIMSELFPDQKFTGKILRAEQTFEEKQQRFIRVRVGLHNPKAALKLNSLVTAEFPPDGKAGFQLPVSSVYRTGMNAYVWVKTRETLKGTGIFVLRKVTTGAVSDGMITIIHGLAQDEEIALQAGAMTDSETFLTIN